MPQLDNDFQIVSEQRAILRQALAYKRQWNNESRLGERDGMPGDSPRSCLVEGKPVAKEGSSSHPLRTLEFSKGSHARVPCNLTNSDLQATTADHLPPISTGKYTTVKNPTRNRVDESASSIFGLPTSATASRSELHDDEIQSVCESQLSHRAVSSVCRDASEVSRFSQRVRMLEEKLEKEEELRMRMACELRELKVLLEAERKAKANRKRVGNVSGK